MISATIKYLFIRYFPSILEVARVFPWRKLPVCGWRVHFSGKWTSAFLYCCRHKWGTCFYLWQDCCWCQTEDGNSHVVQDLLPQMWRYLTGDNVWGAVRHRFHISMYLSRYWEESEAWYRNVSWALLLQVPQLPAFVKVQQRRHCTVWSREFSVPPGICSLARGRYKAAGTVKIGLFSGNRNTWRSSPCVPDITLIWYSHCIRSTDFFPVLNVSFQHPVGNEV